MTGGATTELSEFVAGHPLDRVPGEVRAEAVRAMFDFAGVAWRGRLEPVGAIVEGVAARQFGSGDATVVGSSTRLSPVGAALVNGTCGHALDYDDIGLDVGHPTTAILPAALAAAELVDADGARLVGAMALGYEVAARFARLTPDNLSGPYAVGYHGTSIYGIFGAVAAAARLLGLDAGEVSMALGIAASRSAGLRVNFGTMTKPLHAGQSSADGLLAALLAADGFTASAASIEGKYGWLDVIGGKPAGAASMTDALGGRWALAERLWFKPYPCCGANQYAIDGIVRLMSDHGLKAADVDRVRVSIDQRYLDEVLVYEWPTTGLEGKFSLAYNVAAAVADGAVGLATYADDRIGGYEPFRKRIEVDPRTDIDRHSVIVRIDTVDGNSLSRTHDTLHGSQADPLTWDELARKFRDNVDGMPAVAVDRAIAAIAGVDDPGVRVADLLRLLAR